MYVRMVFIMLISLYTSRIVLEILGFADFGIYNLIGGIISIFTVVSYSLSTSVQRFLNMAIGKGDAVKLKRYFSQSFSIFVFLFAAFLLIGMSAGVWFVSSSLNIPAGRETAAMWVYFTTLAAVLFSILQIPFSGAVIAHEKMGFFAMLGIVDVCIRLVVVVLLKIYGSPDNLISYSICIAAIQVLLTVSYMFYAGHKFDECTFSLIYDRKTMKEMLSFMGLSLFGNTASSFTMQGINVILNWFFGTVVNAARGIASQVNIAVLRLVECINTPTKPQIVQAYASGDYERMFLLFEKNTKYTSFLMIILCFPLFTETEFILRIWLGKVPLYANVFTRIVLLESFFAVYSYSMSTVIGATGKLRHMEFYGRFIILAVLPVAYFLLKAGAGPAVPMIVSMAAQILYVSYLLFDMKRLVNIDTGKLFTHVVKPILILIFCLSAVCVPEYLFMDDSVLRFFVIGFSSVAVSLASIYVFGLDENEKRYVKSLLHKKSGKRRF
jgi:O-antigen/teichoic acid export membrane protein